MLIALHQPIMKVYRIKGGAYDFSGNVVNLVQNIDQVIHQLPRTLATVNMVVVRKRTGDQPMDYRDFKVNRNHITQWLVFLKAHNPYYHNIDISDLAIESLPVDPAEVYNQLTHISNDIVRPPQNNNNNNPNMVDNDNGGQQPPHIDNNNPIVDDDDDYGQHEGPINHPEGQDDVLQTGIAMPIDTVREEQHIQDDIMNPLQFPDREATPIDEFNIFAKTFPTKFPFGVGDPTDQARIQAVS
jgi:hypothetical protein